MWSRGNFVQSVGFVQLDIVQNYVKTQNENYIGNHTFQGTEDVITVMSARKRVAGNTWKYRNEQRQVGNKARGIKTRFRRRT